MKKTTILLVLSFLTVFLLNISELTAGNFLKKIAGETTVNAVSVFTEKAVPEAAFQADLTLIPEGNSINFTDQSTGTPTTWTWTFTGGTPATYSGKVPPPIYYNTAGSYNVSLTVINGDGSDTETKTNYITVAEYPSGWDFTQRLPHI